MTARDWLRENRYQDIANLIDEVTAECKGRGSRERRNWWDVLAGGTGGRPCIVSGREFPVLWSAQRRQGRPTTPNALRRNVREKAPPVRTSGRWPTGLTEEPHA
jgi:hypothetical protein